MSIRYRPQRAAAGGLVALALLAAACSEPASLTAPDLVSKSSTRFSLTAPDFAVLANAAVTCTGGTITGNVGTYLDASAGGVVTQTICPVTGTVHVGDAFAKAAYEAFKARYVALTPALGECTTVNTLTGTLANVSLAPGTYCVSAEAKTGVLTLTGSGPWTFKVLGALTGTNFKVLVEDPSKACDVTWWVQAASTMTTSDFVGNIMAGAAITMTGGTIGGNVWAGAAGVGDVTFSTGTAVTGCKGDTVKPPKSVKPEKSKKSEKCVKSEKSKKSVKSVKGETSKKSVKAEKSKKSDKCVKSEKSKKSKKSEQTK